MHAHKRSRTAKVAFIVGFSLFGFSTVLFAQYMDGSPTTPSPSNGNVITSSWGVKVHNFVNLWKVNVSPTIMTDKQIGAAKYCDQNGANCETISSLTTEDDPQVGVTTNAQWCRGNGTQVVCDQAAPSAAGDNLGNHTATTTIQAKGSSSSWTTSNRGRSIEMDQGDALVWKKGATGPARGIGVSSDGIFYLGRSTADDGSAAATYDMTIDANGKAVIKGESLFQSLTQIAPEATNPDTDAYAPFGVTRPNTAANNSYIAMTKQNVRVRGLGIDANSDMIIGGATSAPLQTIPTPAIKIHGADNMVTMPNGNFTLGTANGHVYAGDYLFLLPSDGNVYVGGSNAPYDDGTLHVMGSATKMVSIRGPNGGIEMINDTGSPELKFSDGGTNIASIFQYKGTQGDEGALYIGAAPGQNMYLYKRGGGGNIPELHLSADSTIMHGNAEIGARLYVGAQATESNYSLVHFKNGTTTAGGIIRASQGNDDTGNAPLKYQGSSHLFEGGNVGIGVTTAGEKLEVSGNIKANGFFYSSDLRLKKDIIKITDPITKVMELNGYAFVRKESGDKAMGLIAQEVETVFPELVSTNAEGYKSVQYGNLVALLIEGMKQQQKYIEALQQKTDTLEQRIEKLESMMQ